MKDNNYSKSFEIMKFLGLVAMILTHCFIFLYRVYPEYSAIQNLNVINRFAYFNGLYSMTLPALAGVYYYEKLKNHLRGQYLTNLDITRYLKPIGILFLMESCKNALIFGWESFFRWDVLHFISMALTIMTILLIKWGVRSFYYILVGSLFCVLVLSYHDMHRIFFQENINTTMSAYLLGCVIFLSIIFVVLNNLIKMKKLISFVITITIFFVFFFHGENSELRLIVSNYPISIFIQLGQNGGHIWPLFPWFNCLLTGFLLARFFNETHRSIWRSFFYLCLFQIPIIYFIFFSLETYQGLLSKNDFFSSMFFSPHWQLFVILNVFFMAAAFSFDFLFKIKNFPTVTVSLVNQYILPIYFVHVTVVWKIANRLTRIFPLEILKWLYPVIVIFLTYCFIQLFLLASDKMIWFRLRKKYKR